MSDLWKGSEFGDELSEMGEVHPGPLKLNRYILEALQDEGLVQVLTPTAPLRYLDRQANKHIRIKV